MTGHDWLRKWRILGSPGTQRIDKQRPGRPPKVSDSVLDLLLSPTRNPIRNRPLPVQIRHHNINCSIRTLQKDLETQKEHAEMYKQAKVKEIREKNKKARVQYGEMHLEKSKEMEANIEDYFNLFWKFVFFTDEAHFNPSAEASGRIL